jgi:hypothetical protein
LIHFLTNCKSRRGVNAEFTEEARRARRKRGVRRGVRGKEARKPGNTYRRSFDCLEEKTDARGSWHGGKRKRKSNYKGFS